LAYPQRIKSNFPRFDFLNYPSLTFTKPDSETFRNLALAFEAMNKCGNMPCIMNAANEIAVEAFLNDKVGFLQMTDVIETCMNKVSFIENPSLEDYINADVESRKLAKEIIYK
jgi:1-deoxy-D-xylulose-5-phosphate reductoisomerase